MRFFVTKDTIAHAKIYLLETGKDDPAGDVARREIVGSANLSERAFSEWQAETSVVFDDDEIAWPHYTRQYEAVRDASRSRVPVTDVLAATEKVRIERTTGMRVHRP